MNEWQKLLPHDETFKCVKCGYCLPVCPTYKVLEKESASPRGRIALVKAAAEGKIDVLQHLAGPIDLCLGCRACEVACPAEVKYGVILEGAKQAIHGAKQEKKAETPLFRWLEKLIFQWLFPYPGRLKALSGILWFYQKTGFARLVEVLGFSRFLPYHLGEFAAALPAAPFPLSFFGRKERLAPRKGKKARVAFFTGCIMDSLFFETNRKSIELLAAVGCETILPKGQTCCGALHAHAGKISQAKKLAKRNIEAFERSGADWVVTNAGGCGAMLAEYHHLLSDEPEWAKRAQAFAAKCRDLSTLLEECGPLPFKKKISCRITYQDSCHLRNVQNVISAPRKLLHSLPGAEVVELCGAGECCGSAGIYNLIQYETSMKVLDRKMEAVRETDAEILVTSNPGCLLQMRLGIRRAGLENRMKAVHLADLLHEACTGE
ncbi:MULTISPECIES: (Fe-S)-binding protein [unclassified Thermoactinomyces]|uniref:(Fe-S)-binding protein n=1 Tax=unclassified Thermoactinomyces TaxID=2634588 RepID=UPI0018DC2883|nr:(Fe-S)-binding protein [Thermoactinomyces sp. CICC 10523]MBH8605170.1 (Fe-S)-binding protein [Thermoactinomyces sp. CICC 10522]MBH8608290.1 (Fe-S)-binding protein [Thermoactinomyces sp. CICC 10521]